MKVRAWLALALILCLTVSLAACGSNDTAVYVQSVSNLTGMGGIAAGDRFPGMVVSENVTEIKKDSEKTVKEVLVKEGDDVNKGDKLFEYDTDELQLSLEKKQLELEQLNASIENYQQQIKELEKERGWASGSDKLQYTIQIQTAQVDMKEAELNAKAKQTEVTQAENLLKNATVEQAKNAAGILRSGLVDGVICYNEGQANTFIMELDAGIPVVKIDPVITDDYPATVGIDLKTGIEKLCAHLEAVGVRRLGYIGPVSDASSGQKVDALKHYCAGSGLYLDPDVFLTDCYTYGGGFDCCRRLLDSGVLLPDAIVVESDMIALGVLKCLVGRGVRVPEDIRLTGYDNTDISVMSNPSLTSVDIPMEDICLAALNMLCALMRGEAVEPVIFRTGLKIRASTMPPD